MKTLALLFPIDWFSREQIETLSDSEAYGMAKTAVEDGEGDIYELKEFAADLNAGMGLDDYWVKFVKVETDEDWSK